MKIKGRPTLSVVICCCLTACGGGGGGQGPAFARLSYQGATDPVVINAANAEGVAAVLYDSISVAMSSDLFAVDTADISMTVNETRPGPQGGTRTITGTVTNGTGTLAFSFNDYRDAGVIINGAFTQQVLRNRYSSLGESIVLDFTRMTIADATGTAPLSLTFSGTIARETLDASPGALRRLTINLVLRDDVGGEMDWIRNLIVDRHEETPPVGFRMVETYAGQVYDSAGGYATVSTDGALFIRSLWDDQPPYGGGMVKFTGADAAVWLKPLNAVYASVLLDQAKDGIADSAKRVRWDSFGQGGTLGIAATTRSVQTASAHIPEASAISTGQAKVGDQVPLSGLFSTDADGDFLSYEWQLALAPPGSLATLRNATSPLPDFTPDLAGDYLVTVRVSDGVHAAHDSVRVVAVSMPQAPDNGSIVVVLNRPPDAHVNQTVQLDATGSYHDLFDETLAYYWTIAAPDGNVTQPGQSADGQMPFTPTVAGLYGVSVQVCKGYDQSFCSYAARLVSVDTDLHYYQSAHLTTGYFDRNALVADFNNDGLADIALTSATIFDGTQLAPDSMDILLQRSHASFQPSKLSVPATGATAVGDINGDGIPDIVGIGNVALYVARGIGDGTFSIDMTQMGNCTSGTTHGGDTLAIADANADGRADLLRVDYCRRQLVTSLQTVAGDLEMPSERPLPIDARYVAIGDVSGDGRADMVIGATYQSSAPGSFRAALAQSDGSFVDSQSFNVGDCVCAPVVAIGDITDDGRNDVVAYDGSSIFVAQGLGTGLIASPIAYRTAYFGGLPPLIADLDGDGRRDLLFARAHLIAFQTPAGTLGAPTLIVTPPVMPELSGGSITPADINNDGLIDLIGDSTVSAGNDSGTGPVVLLGRPADE